MKASESAKIVYLLQFCSIYNILTRAFQSYHFDPDKWRHSEPFYIINSVLAKVPLEDLHKEKLLFFLWEQLWIVYTVSTILPNHNICCVENCRTHKQEFYFGTAIHSSVLLKVSCRITSKLLVCSYCVYCKRAWGNNTTWKIYRQKLCCVNNLFYIAAVNAFVWLRQYPQFLKLEPSFLKVLEWCFPS